MFEFIKYFFVGGLFGLVFSLIVEFIRYNFFGLEIRKRGVKHD